MRQVSPACSRTQAHIAAASFGPVRVVGKWVGRSARSCQTPPPAGAGCTAASYTVVSAPPSASRSTGRITLRNVGSDPRTPGVSAQPGWVA